jgi:hypothetical protein
MVTHTTPVPPAWAVGEHRAAFDVEVFGHGKHS